MQHYDSGIRGMGGALVGCAAAMFAHHADMPEWQIITVFLMVAIGLSTLVGGRLKNW